MWLTITAVIIVLALAVGAAAYFRFLKPRQEYERARELAAAGKFDSAEAIFRSLGMYGDSPDRLNQLEADRLYVRGRFREAYAAYAVLPADLRTHDDDYNARLAEAEKLLAAGEYDEAAAVTEMWSYVDGADELNRRIQYQKAAFLSSNEDYDGAIGIYRGLGKYGDSQNLGIQAMADRAYARGNLAGAWDFYSRLDTKYHTHESDYAAAYTTAEKQLAAGQYDEAIVAFDALGAYRDSETRVKEAIYAKAEYLRAGGSYDAAIALFRGLGDYMDCEYRIKQAAADKLYASGNLAGAYTAYAAMEAKYRTHEDDYAAMYAEAEESLSAGKYTEAVIRFNSLGSYSDAPERTKEASYALAENMRVTGNYEDAVRVFTSLGEYSDSAVKAEQAAADRIYASGDYAGAYEAYAALDDAYRTRADEYAAMYAAAEESLAAGNYNEAIEGFTVLGGYGDSAERVKEAIYAKAEYLRAGGAYDDAIRAFRSLGKYLDSEVKAKQTAADRLYAAGDFAGAARAYSRLGEVYRTHEDDYAAMYAAAEENLAAGNYDEAVAGFTVLGKYNRSAARAREAAYAGAEALYADGKYDEAEKAFGSLGVYSDSVERAKQAHADRLYESGDYAGAYRIYASLDETYRTHADDYAAMYAAAEESLAAGNYDEANAAFAALGGYGDAAERKAEAAYLKAAALSEQGKYEESLAAYVLLGDYMDSAEQADRLRRQIADEAYADGDYAKALDYYALLERTDELKERIYDLAQVCYENGNYDLAQRAYETLGQYRLSVFRAPVAGYVQADELYEKGEYENAAERFETLGDMSDSSERAKQAKYLRGEELLESGDFDGAKAVFADLRGYGDSLSKVKECDYRKAKALMESGDYQAASQLFDTLEGYLDSAEQAKACRYALAERMAESGNYTGAAGMFATIKDYNDSAEQVRKCLYLEAERLFGEKKYDLALEYYQKTSGYEESAERMRECHYHLAEEAYGRGEYENALSILENITGEDVLALSRKCWYALGEKEIEPGNIRDAALNYSRALPDADAQERLYVLGADYAAVNETAKAIELLWMNRDYEPSGAKLEELSGTLAASGRSGDALMGYLAAGNTDRAAELLETVSMAQWEETLENYGYFTNGDFRAEMKYRCAELMLEKGRYEDAAYTFAALGEYGDSADRVREISYIQAKALAEEGDYDGAVAIFNGIRGYKDVDSLLENDPNLAAAAAKTAKYSIGSYVTFGHYPQTAEGNDNTPIEWLVLDVQDGKALLLSRYGLDAQPYNTSDTDTSWEKCSLRTWLNGTFMNRAFTAREQAGIPVTMVDNGASQGNYRWSVGGKNTEDRLFLLSCAEAEEYLGVTWEDTDNTKSRVQPSAYAALAGARTNAIYQTAEKAAAGWWWLRSPGRILNRTAVVDIDGSLLDAGVTERSICVRPALWVDLNALGIKEEAEDGTDFPAGAVSDPQGAPLSIGGTVTFGHYPQTASGNDSTPIEWVVLDMKDGKALLLSRYGLDVQPYNTEFANVTWEKCSLRTWLNGTFLNKAFTVREQTGIVLTKVDNGAGQGYSGWRTSGGNDTEDRIFLLSYEEANRYLGVTYRGRDHMEPRAAPTAYAMMAGAYTSSSNNTAEGAAAGWWWLRSPGDRQYIAADVHTDGSLNYNSVSIVSGSVRPALWVDLESGIF